jgi:flagellar protein FlaG
VGIPDAPPAEVRDAIGAAAARAAELRSQNRELHFEKDESSGRVIIQVRDLAGNVIRTIPPSSALEIMSGAAI